MEREGADGEERDQIKRRHLNPDNNIKGEETNKKCNDQSSTNFVPLKTDVTNYGALDVEAATQHVSDVKGKFEINKLSNEPDEEFGFDIQFLKRFYHLHGILFMHIYSVPTAIFLFLLCLVLLQEYIIYQVGLIASGFYQSLGDKDLQGFWVQTAKSVALILAVSFITSTTQYIQKVITAIFRKILTEAAHREYFADIHFYQLNVLDKAIDNPDQRMTQDIDKFCATYCDVLPKLLISPFTIAYYCYQGYLRSGWQGPVGCFGFFLVATCINKFLMSPVVNFVVKQEKREGDFRFVHMLVRVFSESIAFQQASLVENEKAEYALKQLVDTQHSLYLRQYFLVFATNFFDYIGSIFSYLMLAIPIFSGEHDHLTPVELSILISQNAFILIYLIFTFTSLVDLSGKFTDVAGVTHRIAQLFEKLNTLKEFWKDVYSAEDQGRSLICNSFDQWSKARKKIQKNLEISPNSQGGNDIDVTSTDSQRLLIWSLENVTVSPPTTEEPLVANLSLEFVVGESVLITGTSSAGKTSILRVLRGLWPCTSGSLKRHFPPGPHGVYFCPQKAYLTWGTLREQISFPLYPDINNLDDKLILHYFDKLRLTALINRVGGLDVACSWSVYDSLSPGEIQRLCLLRIFYHQPVVAVLDEVTSALPLNIEEFVYSELKRLGITLISVGHRESIRKYHEKQLILISKGKWQVFPIVHAK